MNAFDVILAKTLVDLKKELPQPTKTVDNDGDKMANSDGDKNPVPKPEANGDRDDTVRRENHLTTTTVNEPEAYIAGGLPMNVSQMQAYLQAYYGIPVALRRKGTTKVTCPYCKKSHDHPPEPGYQPALCDYSERFNGLGLVINDRYFTPAYGIRIYEYEQINGVMHLIYN